MSAIKVKATQFQGLGKVFSRDPDGLAAILRGLAIDNAQLKVQVAAVKDFTDSSGGTASGSSAIVALTPLPSGAVDASGSPIGASASALNTSLGKLQNACKVMTNTLNEARSLLGLTSLVCSAGTQAVADTIPAQDTAATTASGTYTATYVSAKTAMQKGAANVYMLAEAANEVFVAVGVTPLSLPKVSRAYGVTLNTIGTASASASGSDAAKAADLTTWLAAVANDIATIAAKWNSVMAQADTTPLHVVAG